MPHAPLIPDRPLPPAHDASTGPSRNAALWVGVFAAPAAWSVDALAAVVLHNSYCAGVVDHRLVPFAGVGIWLSLLGLVTASVATWGGLTAWRALRSVGADTGRDGTHLDRRRFMARFGLVGSGLFLFGIVLRWITILFVSPFICTLGS